MLKKSWPLLTVGLLLSACGGGSTPDGSSSSVTVAANATTIALSNSGSSTTSTTYTFTNKAGGQKLSVNSAILKYGTNQTAAVALAGFTVPAGVACSDGSTSGCSTANLQFSDQSIQKVLSDSDLFGKLVAANPGVKSIPVELDFAGVANGLNFVVNVGAADTTTTPAAPTPLVVVNNTETGAISNILSVTVSGGFAAGVQPAQLILEVTDSRGVIDTTSYTSTNTTTTFSVDTTKYPDGILKLRAIAIDKNGLRGESAVKQVQILNLVAPSFDLITPVSGSTVNGSMVAKVQIRKNNTDFTYAPSVTFNVRDYRGQILRSLPGVVKQTNPGVYEASATFDINGPDFPNNIYTIEALETVNLTGETASRVLQAQSQFTTQNTNNKPPALIIQMPVRPNTFDLAAKKFPVINRNSGVMVQISDDNNISNVQMQLTCDQSISLASQTCPASAYQINFPINASGLLYRVFNIGALLDGQPYVENGNYILRFTVSDGTNTNIQEIPVTVDRTRNTIANLTTTTTAVDPNTCSGELTVDSYLTGIGTVAFSPATSTSCTVPGSFTSTLNATQNPVRVISLEYSSIGNGMALEIPTLVGIAPELVAGSTISGGEAPGAVGSYRVGFLVEDLVTGVLNMYQGTDINVKKNP
ncbi:hypothetical protein MF271_03370 [Deinococcus sp. KNUC1210]|uniref:hypothetical protein n=1 Tax=Deinococcus sp. KNUC1210 TaxID=2917691 RepID=UPI001EF03603|nr:hypothetical protein [Deinococcus sp. KNUC1210]ULH15694.1 hypothetical protein MF271_03370 [Deinococcus sp. KNUC1210]